MRSAAGVALSVLGLVGGPAGLAAQAQAPVGEMTFVRNEVVGTPPGGAAVGLAVGDDLVLRHSIETGRDAGARIALGADGTLSLGAETEIVLDELVLAQARAGRSRLSLLLGALRLKVGALFGGELEIDTPTAVVGIKGTDVRVEADARATTVTVFEGTVTVLGKLSGKAVEVAAGRTTRVEGDKRPTRPKKADPALDVDPAEGPPATGRPPRPPAPGAGTGKPPRPGEPPGGHRPPESEPAPPKAEPPRPAPQAPPSGKPPQPPPAAVEPGITVCAGRGQAGETVCVCGSFPGEAARALSLGGRPLEVVSASPERVLVRLPEDAPAGAQVIAGDPRAGFDRSDRCALGVLVVEAEYKERLKQGRATYLILRVRGTTERMQIRLQNLSPRIIRVKGGVDQVLTTRGGRNNTARVRVKAIGDGRAHLRHQLVGLATCPCAAGPG